MEIKLKNGKIAKKHKHFKNVFFVNIPKNVKKSILLFGGHFGFQNV